MLHLSSGHTFHVRNYDLCVATAHLYFFPFSTTAPDIFIFLLHFLLISRSNQRLPDLCHIAIVKNKMISQCCMWLDIYGLGANHFAGKDTVIHWWRSLLKWFPHSGKINRGQVHFLLVWNASCSTASKLLRVIWGESLMNFFPDAQQLRCVEGVKPWLMLELFICI